MTTPQREIVREDCRRSVDGYAAALQALRGGTLVVTGGTGFMGTWLAEMVACLNDEQGFGIKLALVARHASRWGEVAPHLAGRADVRLLEKDIRDLVELPAETGWVIHAAASPDNRLHASDPVRTIDVIVGGTRAALEAAARLQDLRRFLNVSSGLVGGAQPWDMTAMPETFCGPVDFTAAASCYAEAKRLAETLCAAYRGSHRLPILTARPFAFVGPYQLLDRPWAINNFIRDGLQGGPIRILGDGQTVRSYMYPSDMAVWLLVMLVAGKDGAAYNVGSPYGIKLKDLAEKVAAQFPTPPRIELGLFRGGRAPVSKFIPDISAAQGGLGLEIRMDLDATIQRTLLWHRQA
jgi:dTDP-glucose 4,6-dehydratase